MREFTKSIFGFSWAMTLFSIQQLANVFTPGDRKQMAGKATEAFESLAGAAAGQLDDSLKQTFKAGDDMQRRMVHMMFDMLTLQSLRPGRRPASDGADEPGAVRPQAAARGFSEPSNRSSGWGPL